LWFPRLPSSTLFPYTTLFRSESSGSGVELLDEEVDRLGDPVGGHGTGELDALALGPVPGQEGSGPEGGGVDEAREGGCHRLSLRDRKSTRLNSSHVKISYAVF